MVVVCLLACFAWNHFSFSHKNGCCNRSHWKLASVHSSNVKNDDCVGGDAVGDAAVGDAVAVAVAEYMYWNASSVYNWTPRINSKVVMDSTSSLMGGGYST